MAKVDLARAYQAIHGKIGGMLFKNQDGKQFAMGLPDYSGRPLPAQLEAQKPVMSRAGLAWHTLKAEKPLLAAAYMAKAKQLKLSVFSLFYADFSGEPCVQELDVSQYSGRAGQKIPVCAEDVFDVREVQVTIRASGGAVLESGLAARVKPGGDWWMFVAKTDLGLAAGTTVEAMALSWLEKRNSRIELVAGGT
jgi:hypothetical protein